VLHIATSDCRFITRRKIYVPRLGMSTIVLEDERGLGGEHLGLEKIDERDRIP
jgi:hypothetical protein